MLEAIVGAGYNAEGTNPDFDWNDREIWKQSANNTKWCLIGCSIGEFGTLAYYSYSGITADLELFSKIWYFYAILPLINGLATSVMLETTILMRPDGLSQRPFYRFRNVVHLNAHDGDCDGDY